ncbi:hypothetical protein CAXC1_80058 [Candidatus Xenohaliotis californiensis]|uniref:Uncharacterized protein n=1 Tax=Candidatus Xenohaliotis californiensis TaxID=84677 RepID=A0ABM9N9K0_9RICK|nr:hypothetical protein CAXC1_80058 [Candidatus Xenohaliotis californiensis]
MQSWTGFLFSLELWFTCNRLNKYLAFNDLGFVNGVFSNYRAIILQVIVQVLSDFLVFAYCLVVVFA